MATNQDDERALQAQLLIASARWESVRPPHWPGDGTTPHALTAEQWDALDAAIVAWQRLRDASRPTGKRRDDRP